MLDRYSVQGSTLSTWISLGDPTTKSHHLARVTNSWKNTLNMMSFCSKHIKQKYYGSHNLGKDFECVVIIFSLYSRL